MKFAVNTERIGSTFAVSNEIVDKHLRIASGEQIKVLLLVLRKGADKLDENKIAKALKYDVSDVEDYLQYWINTGILTETEQEESVPAKQEEPAEPVKYIPGASAEVKKQETESKPAPEVPEYIMPTQSELAERIEESAELRTLFNELQAKLGKTFGHDAQCMFLLLHDHYGLSIEVIFMLVDYCVSIGKTGYSYIKAVGINWSEQEIDTIDKAAEKISSLKNIDSFWDRFKVATGISVPKPTTSQKEKIEHWLSMKMSFEMILYAYEKMAERTGKLNFNYMDKMLTSWYEKGYKTTDDVKNGDAARNDAAAKKPSGKSQSGASYDLGKFTENAIRNKLEYKKKGKK